MTALVDFAANRRNLFADLKTCWSGLQMQHCQRVLPQSIWPHLSKRGLLGYAKISVDSDDKWDFDEAGKGHLTVTVYSDEDSSEVADIVAFDPAASDRWYLRTGAAGFLGEHILAENERAWDYDQPPLVVPSPMEWLKAGGNAVCVINPSTSALARLRDLKMIRVPSARFAAGLRLQMSKPPRLPEIKVVGGIRRAA